MTKAEKKLGVENLKLQGLVGDFVLSHNGRQGSGTGYRWVLPTIVGDLSVTIHDNINGGLVIFCRYEDPERAGAVLGQGFAGGFNPHSGKWNHHFDSGLDAEQCFKHWVNRLTQKNLI